MAELELRGARWGGLEELVAALSSGRRSAGRTSAPTGAQRGRGAQRARRGRGALEAARGPALGATRREALAAGARRSGTRWRPRWPSGTRKIARLQREVADKTERLGRLAKELGELKAKGIGKIFR